LQNYGETFRKASPYVSFSFVFSIISFIIFHFVLSRMEEIVFFVKIIGIESELNRRRIGITPFPFLRLSGAIITKEFDNLPNSLNKRDYFVFLKNLHQKSI